MKKSISKRKIPSTITTFFLLFTQISNTDPNLRWDKLYKLNPIKLPTQNQGIYIFISGTPGDLLNTRHLFYSNTFLERLALLITIKRQTLNHLA